MRGLLGDECVSRRREAHDLATLASPIIKHCYPIVCYSSFYDRARRQTRYPRGTFNLCALFRAEEVRLRLVRSRSHRPERTWKHAGNRGWEEGAVQECSV
jgi:hypothetical protein